MTKAKQTNTSSERIDIATHVTSEIASLLQRGVMPWRAPWDEKIAAASTPRLPLRSTGEPYKGANVILLWASQISRGYSKRTWLTYNQAVALGANVRKGEKATPVVYYGQAKARAGDKPTSSREGTPPTEDAKTYRFLKLFHVFNADQIDGLPESFAAEIASPRLEPTACEAWLLQAGVALQLGGERAYYSAATDRVHMPVRNAFLTEEHFAATLAHESIHWTGHVSRLDTLMDYFSDRKARAREELRAELGAAILGAHMGLAPHHLEDHASYIESWITLLHDEPRAFLAAAAKAQAGVDWILERAGPRP